MSVKMTECTQILFVPILLEVYISFCYLFAGCAQEIELRTRGGPEGEAEQH